jgi:Ca2+/Na+ antiporter
MRLLVCLSIILMYLLLKGKVKCSELRQKDKKELTKQLEDLKQELLTLRVAKVWVFF